MATPTAQRKATPFALAPLPYSEQALALVISANAPSLHHGKHHKAYVDRVNPLVSGTEFEGQPLERIILATSGQDRAELFNNFARQ
jgi:superoxide dismutase, Fe-Mn family